MYVVLSGEANLRLTSLANATDLESWADRRDSQAVLPMLLRRLVQATVEQVLHADFRGGEGVQLGGLDGIVVVDQGNTFVPDGTSAWELSTRKNIKRKADEDYNKRAEHPGGIDPADSTYIFVTPRRWAKKRAWQQSRQDEAMWRQVRAYDADDLESWLELAPAVHIWFSSLIGKRPEGARGLENWWEDWSAATQPRIPPELVLAGRGQVVEKVHEWLRGPSETIALRSESREEALAVFAAALQQLPSEERDQQFSRAVVVRDVSAWDHLTGSQVSLTLLLDFGGDPDAVTRAARKGHRVVVPLGRCDSTSATTLSIPRISRREAAKALTDTGVAEDRARELAVLARRSLTSFRRKFALRPEVRQPRWADPPEARALLPALLAGQWDGSKNGDRQVLAALARGSYEDVSAVLVRWSNEDDPPVRHISEAWYLVSKEDAWSLLARYLTRDDLDLFAKVALNVLGTPDPRFDLPQNEQWKARVLGFTPEHSGLLWEGLADTLAIMGARNETAPLAGGVTSADVAARIVRKLLDRANADWRLWASLAGILPLLAEAAPDEFLNGVANGLEGKSPVLLNLFSEGDSLFGSSPHTGLLWALETLAWSPDHLVRVTLLLGKLARLDPGGQLANRPANSLREIFLLWHPQTAAPLNQRLCVLRKLCESEPEVAWPLLQSLLPQGSSVASGTNKPRWREWAADSSAGITSGELIAATREVVASMLTMVGDNRLRWQILIESLPAVPVDQQDAIIDGLANMQVEHLATPERTAIWNALREFISKHRSYPDAGWALRNERLNRLDEIYNRFEPADPAMGHDWLFTHRPALPEGRGSDWRAYQKTVEAARIDAIHTIYAESGLRGVQRLVTRVECPLILGSILAGSKLVKQEEDELLRKHLAAGDAAYAEFARGFVAGRVSNQGREWAEAKLAGVAQGWSAEQKAELLGCLPCDQRTWDLAQSAGPAAEKRYWRIIPPYWIGIEDTEAATRKFLEFGRPYPAVALLADYSEQGTLPAELIAEALESLLHTERENDEPVGSLSYHVSKLLDALVASEGIDDSRIACLEWAFLPLLDRHERKPELLHRELGRSPDFFGDVVSLVYKAEGEEAPELSSEEQAQSERAWELLLAWRTVPGTTADGNIDGDALKMWVRRARELLAASGRAKVGDQTIGQVLSGSPVGDDGSWPHSAVRDVIEEVASGHLEKGVETGVYNSRGFVSKSLWEGGAQERQLAERYARYAETTRDRWPRTAAMLRRIAARYSGEARQEDAEAELGEDMDR